MRRITRKQLDNHIRQNLEEKAGMYSAAVVVAMLYKRIYGEFPKIGLSGAQADYADGMLLRLPK